MAVLLSLVLGVLGSLRLPWTAGPQEVNPFVGQPTWADPGSGAARAAATAEEAGSPDAAVLRRVADTPQGIWLVPEEHGVDAVAAYVERVVAQAGEAMPLLVLYGVPERDCAAGFSAGGLPAADYLPWVEQVVRGLDGADRAAVVLEPDALLASLECGDGAERLRLLEGAVGLLADSDATVYVDAGHSDWRAPNVVADLLRDVGVSRVRGFATNVANSQQEPDERGYADRVASLLGDAAGRYVIDTGRSGAGPGEDFCNPPGLALGAEPGPVEDGTGMDARLWVKPVGESDGPCEGGPPAGVFWPERAVELARTAGW